jgi:predicted enzyme related to lactoylglutathione lyase
MVKVDSADAVAARVTALGGRALPAFDILQNGRMAVCFDAAGAEFDAWEPRLQPGTDVDSSLHGAPSWFELMTTDVARAARFYGELFGWKARAVPGSGYSVLALGGNDIAGMQAITGRMGKMPSHWATYFTVTDADATARLAVELGAQIDMQPHAASGVRFCGLTSPQGVHFRVVAHVR